MENSRSRDRLMLQVFCRQCDQVFDGTVHHRYCSIGCQKLHRKLTGSAFKIQIKARYGLTLEQYEKLVSDHNSNCAICGSQNSQALHHKKLHIDHCHKSGKVRGLLCHKCNMMLGFAKDNPDILRKAAQYLEERDNRHAGV